MLRFRRVKILITTVLEKSCRNLTRTSSLFDSSRDAVTSTDGRDENLFGCAQFYFWKENSWLLSSEFPTERAFQCKFKLSIHHFSFRTSSICKQRLNEYIIWTWHEPFEWNVFRFKLKTHQIQWQLVVYSNEGFIKQISKTNCANMMQLKIHLHLKIIELNKSSDR